MTTEEKMVGVLITLLVLSGLGIFYLLAWIFVTALSMPVGQAMIALGCLALGMAIGRWSR